MSTDFRSVNPISCHLPDWERNGRAMQEVNRLNAFLCEVAFDRRLLLTGAVLLRYAGGRFVFRGARIRLRFSELVTRPGRTILFDTPVSCHLGDYTVAMFLLTRL